MQKKFIINLLFLIGLNLLVKPFWIFGIDRTVQNITGAGEYGLYFAVMNFSFLFGFILDFGLTGYNNREVARESATAASNTSHMLGMKAVFALLYAMISFFAAFLIGYDQAHFTLFFWIGLNQILSSFILFLRSNISGMQMFITDSLISVLDRLLMIVFFSVLLWGNIAGVEINVYNFAAFQTLSYFIAFLIALALVIRYTRFKKVSWNFRQQVSLFRKSFPFALLSFLMLFYYRADSVMIERLLPDGALHAGIYASAYRILDALGMFSYLFSVLLLPLFSRMLFQKQETGPILHISAVLLLSAAILAATVSLFFSDSIMSSLYVMHLDESAQVLKLLMMGFIPVSAIYIFGTLLTANGNLKILNIIAGLGVFVNVGLNLLLIPAHQEMGAAFSSVITQSAVAFCHVLLVAILIRPEGMRNTLLQLAMYSVFIIGLGYLLQYTGLTWLHQVSLICLSWILFLVFSSLWWFRHKNIQLTDLFSWKKN